MRPEVAKRFAKSLMAEGEIIADTFDGTVTQEHYRARIANLEAAIRIFHALVGMSPAEYLAKLEKENG